MNFYTYKITETRGEYTVKAKLIKNRHRLYQIVEVGASSDFISRFYDFFSTFMLVANLIVSIMLTFNRMSDSFGLPLLIFEKITVAFFAFDYVMRLITAKNAYFQYSEGTALLKYIFSFAGIIDLLSFLPYYMPFFFPTGATVFRMFRVVRIFRLFRLNAYYDSINVITEVIKGKRQQLMSSVFIIFVMMLASSLCMYSLENEAQPEVFANAFSGLWWSVSTLLTVGYGDIYPITPIGKIFGIVITFLGVLLVAIPTGIISAGFVEQYSRLKQLGDLNAEQDLNFIRVPLNGKDSWINQKIMDLSLPKGMIIALIQRKSQMLIPRGDVVLEDGDTVILGAESIGNTQPLNIKEIIIGKNHAWNGVAIRDLDISRQTFILMIRRHDSTLVPNGNLVIYEGDEVILYTKKKLES